MMIFRRLFLFAAISLLLALPATRGARREPQAQAGGQTRKVTFSTPEQMQEDIKAVPCKSNSERLAAVRSLFVKMGAGCGEVENAACDAFR